MLHTRYEEYRTLTNKLPCVFSPALERTRTICSHHTNWHENLEIQICLKGSGYVLLNGEKYYIAPNDIIVVNSNVIHYTGTDNYLVYSCLIIDSSFCKMADINQTELLFEALFQNHVILNLFRYISEIYNNEEDVCRAAKLQAAILNILIELRQNHTLSAHSVIKTNRSFDNVKQTLKFIRENYSQKLSLDMIAKNAAADKYSLSRNFKSLTGQTIVQYINNYRCEKAMELITDGIPVNEAAVMCGFHNMSFFTKIFKQNTGKLPSFYKTGHEPIL